MTPNATVKRIYLDNAATSWPKPEAVYLAVDDCQRRLGAAHGRGTSEAAQEVRGLVDRARKGVARLIAERDPNRVAFTTSGTDSLNTALVGLLRPGDHAVASVVEHNAVLRPLHALRERGVEHDLVGCDNEGRVSPAAIKAALKPNTRLVVATHASNVTGALQPIEAIARVAHDAGALLLVDAAQTLGRAPIDVASFGADLIAAPGHKGLLGPLGTGVLWIAPGLENAVRPLRYGGIGSESGSLSLPERMPEKYEAGNLNAPGIAGLAAGVERVLENGAAETLSRTRRAFARLRAGLESIAAVRLYGPASTDEQAGVVSFSIEGYDPQEVALLLSSLAGVECRAGLHCAPLLHEALGTASGGGLIRFSPSSCTPDDELREAIAAVARLAAATPT